ncbi:hypothetical protein MTO96_013244 [Rhipicephalus appendiculatus]
MRAAIASSRARVLGAPLLPCETDDARSGGATCGGGAGMEACSFYSAQLVRAARAWDKRRLLFAPSPRRANCVPDGRLKSRRFETDSSTPEITHERSQKGLPLSRL